MNAYLLAAAVLAIGVGAAHSWLGERYILIRLFRRPNLPHLFGSDRFTKQTLRFAWHLTTIAWWGFAGLLVLAAGTPEAGGGSGALRVIAGTFLASSAIALVGSRGRHLSWVVFLAVAVATWLGGR